MNAHEVELGARTRWSLALLRGEPADVSAETSTPMQRLVARLGLARPEVDALWLLACSELLPEVAEAAQEYFPAGLPGFSVQILEHLVSAETRTIARLVQLALVETSDDPRLPRFRRPVRVADRVLALARGELELDPELHGIASLRSPAHVWSSVIPDELPRELSQIVERASKTLVIITGVEGSGRATLAAQAIAGTGTNVLVIRATDIAQDAPSATRQLRALARECRLHEAWPIVRGLEALGERFSVFQRELLDVLDLPVFATTNEPRMWPVSRPSITVRRELPDHNRRRTLWHHALAGAPREIVAECADRYTVTPALIGAAAASTIATAADRSSITCADVHASLRAEIERKLSGLATRIETRQTWDDLVLPQDQCELLIELVARIRHRKEVLETWGFADKIGRGTGLAAMFSGPPGTGKTMIAGLIAKELGLDLYQVDLSRVVSKYIGETEKQLAALFEAAESGQAILLFDEADSLFGKRTEVKSSNDRYANLEVNYLLQRMEAFRGITLLTTNHETAIDPAFQRRLAVHVRVPMPDEAHREMLWRAMIPERAPREDLDTDQLAADFVMTGGYIKNAVVRAAFLAADARTPISTRLLRHAARAEYEAMGKVAFR